ncbi:hypothetical protein D3C77_673840 [compost metagenome]
MNEEIDDDRSKYKDNPSDNKWKGNNFNGTIMNNGSVKINDHHTDDILIRIMVFKNRCVSA